MRLFNIIGGQRLARVQDAEAGLYIAPVHLALLRDRVIKVADDLKPTRSADYQLVQFPLHGTEILDATLGAGQLCYVSNSNWAWPTTNTTATGHRTLGLPRTATISKVSAGNGNM